MAAVFALGAAGAVGVSGSYWWHVGVLGSALGILCACLFAGYRLQSVLHVLIVAYASSLSLLTISQGLGVIGVQGFDWGSRVRLFFTEPNTLAAALVVAVVAALVVARRFVWLQWLVIVPLGSLALVYTASRTAFVAFVLGLGLWALVGELSRRMRVLAVAGLVVLAAGFGGLVLFAMHEADRLAESRNLLRSSQDFEKGFWVKHYADHVSVRAQVVEGPLPGTRADRVQGRSRDDGTLLMYHLTVSAPSASEESWVGSIYLRADEPQELVLRITGGARTTCTVADAWQRCVTPVGYGSSSNLRIETLERGASADFYAFGAQLEIGTAATALEEKRLPLVDLGIIRNFDPRGWASQFDTGSSARGEILRAGWVLFTERPWAGHGLGAFRERHVARADLDLFHQVGHAHNLPLQLLAETGILGFLSWAIPFFGVLALGWRRHWRRLLPLVVAVLVLNTFDFTFYSNGVYYVYWLTVGLVLFSPRTEVEGGRDG